MPTAPNTIQLRKPDGSIAYPITDVSCVMGLNGSAVTEAILCWDGASTPVVADIPAGVTVTYNGQTYTGTLAASSSTTGKIYMVATGVSNNYDRYMTFASGSSYAWENIGDTTIDLTSYVTQTQFSQLEHEVDDLDEKTENFTHSKNLADKATEVDGYVASNGTFTAASSGEKSIKFPCSPSTTYTISKVQTSRFRVAYYNTNPSAGTSGGGVITDHTASSITITTAADSAYIVAFVYNGSSETVSFADIMASLQIEVGATATPYVKPGWVANDEIARESVASLKEETFDLIAVGDKRNSTSNQTGGIVYSTGARGSSSNFTNYYIPNNGYKKVRLYATQAGTETDNACIGFYNTATIGTSGYISGVAFRGQAGFAWYEANVPNGCVMIAVSNRDALDTNFKVYLYKELADLARQVDANTLVSQSVAEKNTTTSLPITLKNCNLMGGLNISGAYTGDYNIVSHPIRVVPGSAVSFAYTSFDVDGTTTSPLVRVAFYATKEMGSYVSTGQSTYGSPASLVVPSGANYMKVSIGLGVNKYCRNYYVDGAVTISFNEGYPYDFAQEFSNVKAELGARCLELRKADVRTGHFNNGVVVKNSTRISTKEPYKIPEGVTSIVMTRPTSDIFIVQYTWLDANFGYLSASRFDNYERTEVPSGAKYCYISIQKNGASYKVEDMGGDSFFFNLSVVGAFSDDGSIIKQNGKVETAVKLQQVKQPAKLNGVKQTVPLSILFFSDIHGDADNLARIVRFFDYWNATRQDGVWIDAILSGGDNVQTYQAEDAFDYWANVPGAENILQTVGNHDAAANAQLGEYANKKDVYDIEFAPFISGWGVTQPENAATLGLMYYYKDFATQKIRLVVLDCMYWTADQLTWFEGVLADAKTNGYSVVGCVHYPIGYTTPMDCNFLSKDYNPTGGARLLNPIDAVDSFIANGGKFICWLSGHTHADGFGTVTDHAGQINLIIDTACSGNSAAQDAASVVGSRSQDCFNIIGFDTYSKIIKIVRIGRDYDRHLRHIGEMCVDYENGVVLYTR